MSSIGVDQLALPSLVSVFASIPDPRERSGRRHSLPALLSLLVAAWSCGANSMNQVVAFGRRQPALRRALGFTHPKSPSGSTYTRLFKVLCFGALRDAVGMWFAQLAQLRLEGAGASVAVDGKTSRGSQEHSVYVFLQDLWQVVDMLPPTQAGGELGSFEQALGRLLERHPFLNLFTFDALYTQRTVAETITAQGRRAIFQVKSNQRETLALLERQLARTIHAKPDARTVEKKWELCRRAPTVGTSA
jgi:hypothetical protein